jgi:hypothetical protein
MGEVSRRQRRSCSSRTLDRGLESHCFWAGVLAALRPFGYLAFLCARLHARTRFLPSGLRGFLLIQIPSNPAFSVTRILGGRLQARRWCVCTSIDAPVDHNKQRLSLVSSVPGNEYQRQPYH